MILRDHDCIRKRGWDKHSPRVADSVNRLQQRLERRAPDGAFSLTKLQEQAIGTPAFWRDNWQTEDQKHLMIQGATSAGKTLLAELAILDTLAHDKKAIILVPLKSMVNEKQKQFREDMHSDYKIYAASSDYMEYDEALINGDYDVAVIVYEKFFAMLSQTSQKLLSNCGLLVVDELAMLSKEQRGPKLEMAMEIVQNNYTDVRIMCIATSDCRADKICDWLKIDDRHRIFSAARPVALEEHILLLNGEGKSREIPADCDDPAKACIHEVTEHLEIPGYRTDWKTDEKKKRLLQVVLKKLMETDRMSRILIFVNSKLSAASLASFLRDSMQEIFPRISEKNAQPNFSDFMEKLKNCEEDEGLHDLIQNLIPYGLAFHHAGLSTTLRELIEEEYQDPNSFLKVIVATETLTIGVNMPFDAIIMMDSKVPRGEGESVRLTKQEYRNFIGRAGRLGQSNRKGISYMLAEERNDLQYFWNSYNSQEEIESALVKADEEALAPYYLSLLQRGNASATFDTNNIQSLFRESLTHYCRSGKVINDETLCDALDNAYLAEPSGPAGGKKAVPHYLINAFGVHIAPYAFSTDTCIKIYNRFYDGRNYCSLPASVTSEDIDNDRYLLDILYHVCRHKEIEDSSVLTFPKDDKRPDMNRKLKAMVIRQLKSIYAETDPDGNPLFEQWPSVKGDTNELEKYMTQLNLGNEANIAQAALRAILLFHWTRGRTIKEIKEITAFPMRLVSGDIERIAEIASFHLDAIQKCLGDNNLAIQELNITNSFYTLQCRVKYGMSRELVRLANKHIHGLDRNRLLRLEKVANARSMTPVVFLYYEAAEAEKYITPTQRNNLMAALERRGEANEFETLLSLVSKDTGSTLTESQKQGIERIYRFENQTVGDLYEAIRDTVNGNRLLPRIEVFSDSGPQHLVWRSENGQEGGEKLHIGLLSYPCDEESEGTKEALKKFFAVADGSNICKLLLVSGISRSENWNQTLEDLGREFSCETVLDNQFFAFVLAHTILKSLSKEDPLTAFLKDARGIFTAREYKYYSPENYINSTVPENTDFRLVCSRSRRTYSNEHIDISELQSQLGNRKGGIGVLPWGNGLEQLEIVSNTGILLLLEREMIVRSRSLHSFIKQLSDRRFPQTLLILSSEDAEQKWNNAERQEGQGECTWDPNFCGVDTVVIHNTESAAKAAIDYFRENWHPGHFSIGVSYAHEDSFLPEEREMFHSDNALLKQVVDRLKAEYGEHRILFDQYKKANDLFDRNEARAESLRAYSSCKVFLILWNTLTMQNENCQKEREKIFETCRATDARYFYLTPSHAPEVPEKDFSMPLNQNAVMEIVQMVKEVLRD